MKISEIAPPDVVLKKLLKAKDEVFCMDEIIDYLKKNGKYIPPLATLRRILNRMGFHKFKPRNERNKCYYGSKVNIEKVRRLYED